MTTLKVIHVFLAFSWMAGLFYLPRIFVNLAQVQPSDSVTYERLEGMATRLYRFTLHFGIGVLVFGIWLWVAYGFVGGWLHAKFVLAILLLAYHFYCGHLLKKFKMHQNQKSARWFRFFNEVPTLVLLLILIMVIAKPF